MAPSGLTSRCNMVRKAIENAECEPRVKKMLAASINYTIGEPKANRHPFNERFVVMIEHVLENEKVRLAKEVADNQKSFNDLTPQKATRESALEQANTHAEGMSAALTAAKEAVTNIGAEVKAAGAALEEAKKAEKAGNADLDAIEAKKATLTNALSLSLAPIMDGSADEDAANRAEHAKVVLETGKQFDFDKSLLSTAAQVLQTPASARAPFDQVTLKELDEAFKTAIKGLNDELQAGAPGKKERADAVANAEATKQAKEASQADLKEKAAQAKAAKADADHAAKAAAKSLADFMPDLKHCGDRLDKAKVTQQSFIDGPVKKFGDLKDFKDGDFQPLKSYYEKINGLKCDRAIIDECRKAVEGKRDGRVSVEDAKNVFDKMADGNKVTRCERWTLRYCMQEFNWTESAHDWIIEELEKIPQENAERPAKRARTESENYYEQVDGYKCDRAIIEACRTGMEGRGDGRISVDDAKAAWEKAADGNQVTDGEMWTLRYCLANFKWTRQAHDWMLAQMKKGVEPAPAAETA